MFDAESKISCADKSVYDQNIEKSKLLEKVLSEAGEGYFNINSARNKAYILRHNNIDKLEKKLLSFEEAFQRMSGKVVWAVDAVEAVNQIERILSQSGSTKLLYTDSSTEREIGIPASISIDACSAQTYLTENPESQSRTALICEASFLLAKGGRVVINDNSNIIDSVINKGLIIALAGIENIIADYKSLELIQSLYYYHKGVSQFKLVNPQKRKDDKYSAASLFVIIIDNGRSKLLRNRRLREALHCINCGSCAVVCPVYQHTGSESSDILYSGPINSVKAPYVNADKASSYYHHSYASSLCGKCYEICPVKIDIPGLLVYNRMKAVEAKSEKTSYKLRRSLVSFLIQNSGLRDKLPSRLKDLLYRIAYNRFAGKSFEPRFAKESFAKSWGRMREEDNSV